MNKESKVIKIVAVAVLEAAGWHYIIVPDRKAAIKKQGEINRTGEYRSTHITQRILTKKAEIELYESYLAAKNI